ncbi:hypothetical protein HY449_04005 [Candidatus Pacearchaeota archaeon]|nr:hypothetical protein [Candidatus Pacearchaeota archaeon]
MTKSNYYDYLNLNIAAPNIDSASCKKWCLGADTQSACYDKYSQFVGCFKDKFIIKIPEIQSILNENGFDYNSQNIDWFGKCFDLQHTIPCGNRIREIINNLRAQSDSAWLSDWRLCQNQFFENNNPRCNLGLNCQSGAGCYPQINLAGFIPHVGYDFIMGGGVYANSRTYGPYNERIMRDNILRRTRSIIIDYNPTSSVQKTCFQTRTLTNQVNPNLCTADETRASVTTINQCTNRNWRGQCTKMTTFFSYNCVKTTKTDCSVNAVCPAGTTETKSEGCTAASATSGTQKTCEQITKTLTRRTTGENQCGSGETRIIRSSYQSCSGPFYRKTCKYYEDYSCVKTTQTDCSVDATCPTGTTEKSSVACTI